ncbi:OpgC domain-containing protein, partial [Erythrobacter sp. HI0063]|uniref:OpgC domain-containing protein n=2 Tax=Erythrobacter sp. HI0063 TaxID=1822240 RepID=UPI0009EE337B
FSKINRYFYHRSIGRMFKIMAANCVLILLIFSVVSMSPTEVGQVTGVSLNGSANWNAITSALTMLDAPFLATILLLYVKVIAILILFRLALRRTRLIVTISLAIYAFSQTRILSGLPWLEGDFNPLSWQLAFVIPAVTAKECAVWLNRSVNGRGFVVAVPFILVILGFVLKASLRYLTDIDLQEQFLFSKSHLGPLRILSAIVSFVFLFQIFSYLQKYFPKLGNIFGAIGANSLETFIASVVAVYVVGALWLLQPSTISYWAFCLAGSLAVGVFGYLFTQWKRMAI